MNNKFKAGSRYFEGDSLDNVIKIVSITDNGVIWTRGKGKRFARFLSPSSEYQCFLTDKKKRVWSWNISSLHELRKNDFLKNLANELKANRTNV